MADGQLTLSQAHLEGGAERGPTVSRTIAVNPCWRALAACVAVVIAVLTGFGIEAKGIRFVPNEAVTARSAA
jgi:hypothetical protein